MIINSFIIIEYEKSLQTLILCKNMNVERTIKLTLKSKTVEMFIIFLEFPTLDSELVQIFLANQNKFSVILKDKN